MRLNPALVIIVALHTFCTIGSSAGAQPASPPRWKGAVELAIGGADATDDVSFGRVSGLAADAAGRIYVGDAQDQQVRVFSAAGTLQRTIGRSGSGPLEFKTLATITIGPDRLLWTRDEGNARMLAIDVSGATPTGVRNVPLQQFTGGNRMALTFEADGSLVDETIYFDKTTTSFRPIRLRRTISGTVTRADTIPVPAGADAGVFKITRVQKDASGKQIGMSQGFMWQPYGAQWLRAYGPGGLRADVVTSRYEVRIIDASGKTIRTLTRDLPPVAVSSRERKKQDSILAKEKTDLPFGVPAAKAPIVGIMWGQDGSLWVERAVAEGRPRAHADATSPSSAPTTSETASSARRSWADRCRRCTAPSCGCRGSSDDTPRRRRICRTRPPG